MFSNIYRALAWYHILGQAYRVTTRADELHVVADPTPHIGRMI